MRSIREITPWLAMAAIILVPQIYQASGPKQWGLPTVVGGDEPHYLLLLNSVILDGDFDLRNNYLSVHEGSNQAGANFAGSGVDHHTTYWFGRQRLVWRDLFIENVHWWPRDSRGHLIPIVKVGVDPAIANKPEAPAHPVGIAVLLAPIVFPFRGTPWVEHIAIFCAGLATLLAAYFYQRILRYFSTDERAVWVTTCAVFLASPLLFYSRSFFNEPFITAAILGAFALSLVPVRPFAAGLSLAIAVLMKPQNAVLAIPLSFLFLRRRNYRTLFVFGLAPSVACLLTLWWNSRLYGSPWLGPYPFYRGDLWVGVKGLVISLQRGLLWFAPALVFSIFGWPRLLLRFPVEASSFLLSFIFLFVLAAWTAYWDGGHCYGPRLITNAIPLLGVGLVYAFQVRPFTWRLPRFALYAIVLAGLVVNLLAVTHYASSWEMTPLAILQQYLPL